MLGTTEQRIQNNKNNNSLHTQYSVEFSTNYAIKIVTDLSVRIIMLSYLAVDVHK